MLGVDELIFENLDEAIAELQALSPATRRAANRAVRKTVKYVGKQAVRNIAQNAKIAQKILLGKSQPNSKRVFERVPRVTAGVSDGAVWLGFNPIPAKRLGQPRKTRTGVTVGRNQFPGAFIIRRKSGRVGIYRRVAGRIKEVSLPLDQSTIPVDKTVRQGRERLAKLIRQELNYELNVRSGR